MRLPFWLILYYFIGYRSIFLINFANWFEIIIFKTYEKKEFEAIEV